MIATIHNEPLGSFYWAAGVDFLTISGAQDHRGERFVGTWYVHTLQPQRPTCAADGPTFCLPPHHKVEHGAEVSINRIAIPTGLRLIFTLVSMLLLAGVHPTP
jgi:hypothetical protein